MIKSPNLSLLREECFSRMLDPGSQEPLLGGPLMVMSQVSAVFAVTTRILEAHGIPFTANSTVVREVISKEQRAEIIEGVVAFFQAGEVEFKATEANATKLSDPKALKNYVNGLVTNHHKKDKRLNGGVAFEIQNPGSRVGAGDAQLKELRKLKTTLVNTGADESTISLVNDKIEARVEELGADKPKKASKINVDLLPEELRALVA